MGKMERKANAIPGGAAMPLDRAKAKRPTAIPGGGTGANTCWIGVPTTAEKYGGAKDFGTEGNASTQTGTSIFDPVLCELIYRWFAPPSGAVLDPFAGGSVRGIVASRLGLVYTGIDLRAEQVAANEAQNEICRDPFPSWLCGDSRDLDKILPADYRADLVFSCPPYADLERYSDDPADLSTMGYDAFLEAYKAIIGLSCARLKANRFACFVVGEVRDPGGLYRGFVPDTVRAFEAAGMRLYNEAILVTALGSLPIRIGAQFKTGRKLGKTHQNVLVFYNGDPARIRDHYPEDVQAGADLTEKAVLHGAA